MNPWIQAFRLRTLPLAISGIMVGSALAYAEGHFRSPIFVLALITAVLLQILSNLSNDLGDHQHGTDNVERVGPQRTVQSGAISPTAMKRAMLICAALAFTSGIALILMAFGISLIMLAFLSVGLIAIGAAVKYTFGTNPYGYAGLGDLSVFLFFGPVAVIGTCFLHTNQLQKLHLLPAFAFGLLSVGVLNLNNMRDIVNDDACGKRTLPVRMGFVASKLYHTLLIFCAVATLVGYSLFTHGTLAMWIYIPVLFILAIHLHRVLTIPEPRALDPQLKVLALGTFFIALSFSLGLILS